MFIMRNNQLTIVPIIQSIPQRSSIISLDPETQELTSCNLHCALMSGHQIMVVLPHSVVMYLSQTGNTVLARIINSSSNEPTLVEERAELGNALNWFAPDIPLAWLEDGTPFLIDLFRRFV
jgi:hypothetical protein